jgi:hypothetical protein
VIGKRGPIFVVKDRAAKQISFLAGFIPASSLKPLDTRHPASDHFSPCTGQFDTFQELTEPVKVETAQGKALATGVGNITVDAFVNGNNTSTINRITLNNLLYVPEIGNNLLSLPTLYDRGFQTSIKPGHGVNITKNGALVAEGCATGDYSSDTSISNDSNDCQEGRQLGNDVGRDESRQRYISRGLWTLPELRGQTSPTVPRTRGARYGASGTCA